MWGCEMLADCVMAYALTLFILAITCKLYNKREFAKALVYGYTKYVCIVLQI